MQYQPKEFEIVEVEVDGEIIQARRYEDGSLRNELGHPIKGTMIPGGAPKITTDTARDMLARRQNMARQMLIDGANEYVEEKTGVVPPSDLEFVRHIGYANMVRAADPKNAKGVDASRLLLVETKLSVNSEDDSQAAQDDVMRQAIREAAKGARVDIQLREAKLTIRREE